jgi:inorganic pyrophosphatase
MRSYQAGPTPGSSPILAIGLRHADRAAQHRARVSDPVSHLPACPRVRIEVPKGSFVKRKADGRVDLWSPLPCPYNYGSILGSLAPDGDPYDALVLGPRLPAGRIVSLPARAVMGFVDEGCDDPKIVCAARPLRASDRRAIHAFFVVYAAFKRLRQRLRGQPGTTVCTGWAPNETFSDRA